MQNMHKSTYDRPLTGVHWPIHRGWCRGSGTKGNLSTSTGDTHRGAGWRTEAIIHITTRGLDRIIDRTIRMSTRAQEAKGNGPLERNNINLTSFDLTNIQHNNRYLYRNYRFRYRV